MMHDVDGKGRSLFDAALALDETWAEIDRLSRLLEDCLIKGAEAMSPPFAMTKTLPIREDSYSDYSTWSRQFNFCFYRKRVTKGNAAASLHFEFRLCWPGEHKIVDSSGNSVYFPIVIAKAARPAAMDTFSCYDLLNSPAERSDDVVYSVSRELLWHRNASRKWLCAFAVPLFSIELIADLERELAKPALSLISSDWETAEQCAPSAFAESKYTLRWLESSNRSVLLDATDANSV